MRPGVTFFFYLFKGEKQPIRFLCNPYSKRSLFIGSVKIQYGYNHRL